MNKRCSKCKQVKDIDDFYVNKRRLDKHTSACKQCLYEKKNVKKFATIEEKYNFYVVFETSMYSGGISWLKM